MNRIKVPPAGKFPADIMIIGEAPGQSEEQAMQPFVGAAGLEMTKMLHEAGFIRNDCFITNVCKYRPPSNNIEKFFGKFPSAPNDLIKEGLDELKAEILRVKPRVIIAFGNTPLWALTGNIGITKWRGSCLEYLDGDFRCWVVPTYHPAAILRKWDWRFIAVQDLKRARKLRDGEVEFAEENFIVRPSYETVLSTIDQLIHECNRGPLPLAVDIETRNRHIACIGFGWSDSEAICIPFMQLGKDDGYWSEEEEVEIIWRIRHLLTHSNCRVIGQNFPYDTQYIVKHWHFVPQLWWDTMTVHHSMFSTLPKGLDFQSSLYLEDHVYWKDEGKEWNTKQMDETRLWVYNCKDCTRTFRIQQAQAETHAKMQWPRVDGYTALERQMALHTPITKAMIRGVRTDTARKKELQLLCNEQIKKREEFISDVVGYPLNPRSPKQLTGFFYYECGINPIRNHKTGSPTCNEDALATIGQRHAVLRPITDAINEIRSLGTFRAVAASPISSDNRVRCQYSIPGTITFRFASSADAFGDGINLQNVSKGNEKRLAQIYPEGIPSHVAIMPNMRTMMVPDPGMEIGDFDLAQADAQVVAAEANDADLLELFLDPDRDLHNENCELLFGPGSYRDKTKRQMAKTGVHLTNYAGTAFILSKTLGISVYEAEKFQDIWFSAHPGIHEWHERTARQLSSKRFVENRFGYRIYFFDRIEKLLKEALAWIPQSTVAIVTNTGIINIDADEECRSLGIQFLMQVHDSAIFQYPIENAERCRSLIQQKMRVPIPYPTPLTISVGGSFSSKSWGDCD